MGNEIRAASDTDTKLRMISSVLLPAYRLFTKEANRKDTLAGKGYVPFSLNVIIEDRRHLPNPISERKEATYVNDRREFRQTSLCNDGPDPRTKPVELDCRVTARKLVKRCSAGPTKVSCCVVFAALDVPEAPLGLRVKRGLPTAMHRTNYSVASKGSCREGGPRCQPRSRCDSWAAHRTVASTPWPVLATVENRRGKGEQVGFMLG